MVVIRPDFDLVPSVDLVMSVSRERKGAGVKEQNYRVESDVTVGFQAGEEAAHVFTWAVGPPRLTPKIKLDPDVEAAVQFDVGHIIVLNYDANFNFTGLDNLADLVAGSRRVAERVAGEGPDPDRRQHFIDAFSDPAFVSGMASQKPTVYLGCFGWSFEPGQSQEEDIELPNPFGGKPLAARLRVELMPFEEDELNYRVRFHQTIDRESAGEFTRELMERFVPSEQRDQIPEEIVFDVVSVTDYQIDRRTGWPVYVLSEKRATTLGVVQVDRIEITKVP